MSLTKWTLCVLFLGLSACGSKSNSNNSPNPTPQGDGKVEETSTDYSQTANLNLSHTREELKNVKANALTFKGTGSKSVYKATYNFNSQGNTSFKVIETSLKSHYGDCSAPEAKMTLKGKDFSKELSVLDQVNVQPNAEYTLEVAFKNSCKNLEMDFDVIAWAGNQFEDPKVASVCDGQQVMQATFVMNVNMVSAFSSIVGKEKFLTMDTFCGESFRGSKTTCSGQMNIGLSSSSTSLSHADCVAENDVEKRGFSVDFNSAENTAIVSCTKNDAEIYSEQFRSCQSVIVDYKPYNQLLINSVQ